MSIIDRFISWAYVTRLWGPRCPAYDRDCGTCREWKLHDWIFNGGAHPDGERLENEVA